jgi:hypothetical protein
VAITSKHLESPARLQHGRESISDLGSQVHHRNINWGCSCRRNDHGFCRGQLLEMPAKMWGKRGIRELAICLNRGTSGANVPL